MVFSCKYSPTQWSQVINLLRTGDTLSQPATLYVYHCVDFKLYRSSKIEISLFAVHIKLLFLLISTLNQMDSRGQLIFLLHWSLFSRIPWALQNIKRAVTAYRQWFATCLGVGAARNFRYVSTGMKTLSKRTIYGKKQQLIVNYRIVYYNKLS